MSDQALRPHRAQLMNEKLADETMIIRQRAKCRFFAGIDVPRREAKIISFPHLSLTARDLSLHIHGTIYGQGGRGVNEMGGWPGQTGTYRLPVHPIRRSVGCMASLFFTGHGKL